MQDEEMFKRFQDQLLFNLGGVSVWGGGRDYALCPAEPPKP